MKVSKISVCAGLLSMFSAIPMAEPTVASAATNSTAPAISTQALTASSVQTLPDGGQEYIYYINGVKNVFPVPPTGFNPLTATDTQLQEYGFPSRPSDPQKLQQWEQDMSHWKRTLPPKVVMTNISHGFIPHQGTAQSTSNGTNSILGSNNWSGYYNYSSYNEWAAVEGNFTQPTMGPTTCSPAYESAWAGLGGVNSGGLIQAGTELNYNSPYAWYEYLGKDGSGVNEILLPNVVVNTGDNIHVYVSYQSSTGQTDFYVADNTTGTSQSVLVNLSSNYYDGTTAEWIDERPTVNNSLSALANYQQNPWTNAETYSIYGYWNPIGALANNQIYMYDSSGNVMSASSSLTTSSSFTDYWHRCG